MVKRLLAVCAAAFISCALASNVHAAEFRVLHAEPFRTQANAAIGQQKLADSPDLRFAAFGRTFDIDLESNERLLRKLAPATRRDLAGVILVRGTVRNAPDSWVRLSWRDGMYEGAIWDGSELYAIEATNLLQPALATPVQGPASRSLIYRLADTQGGFSQEACGLADSARPAVNPRASYKGLIRELQGAATSVELASAAREIEVAMIGDFEYASQFGSSALSTMANLMNMVDGIFSGQVGVAIVPTDFVMFAADNDPFSSSNPETLLNQVAQYRNATAVVRSRGLAHLVTGRNLDGNTVGVAFLGSLCEARAGVALSESSFDMNSALIIAHEIGHNFGAPHDGAAGSACSSTPQNYLMAPALNNSSTFSTCSIERMQPYISSAACVVNARIRDVAISVPAPSVQLIQNQFGDYAVDVTSAGDSTATNITLSVTFPWGFELQSPSLPGGACAINGSTLNCQLSELPAGETRRLSLRMRATLIGDYSSTVQASSSSDAVGSNNTLAVPINVAAERDLRIIVPEQPFAATAGEPVEVTFGVNANGIQSVAGVRTEIQVWEEVLSASVDGGTCTVTQNQPRVTCDLGTVAAASTRQVRVRLVARVVGNNPLSIRAYPQHDAALLRFGLMYVSVAAARDISVQLSGPQLVPIGADALYSLDVKSNGKYEVQGVQVRIGSSSTRVALQMDAADAPSCTAGAGFQLCSLGTVVAGATRTLHLRARSNEAVHTTLTAEVVSPAIDDVDYNDQFFAGLDIRVGTEIAISATSDVTSYDGLVSDMDLYVQSLGALPVNAATVTASLPEGFTIESAALDSSTPCAVAANVATCTLATLPANSVAYARLTYIAPEPGAYIGSVSVAAAADTNPANNSRAVNFNVRPAVDGSIGMPTAPAAFVNEAFDLVFNVTANRYALPDARLTLSWYSQLAEVTATSPSGTCTLASERLDCAFDVVPANASVPVTLRIRSATQQTVTLYASLSSAADTRWNNNFASMSMPIYVRGDASVSVAAATGTAIEARKSTSPTIDITVSAAVVNAYLDFDIDSTRVSALSVRSTEGWQLCGMSSPPYSCYLGSLYTGFTQKLVLEFTPTGLGALPVTVKLRAPNDTNAANNVQQFDITVEAAPVVQPPTQQPPSSPPPTAGGSGGGGGSMDWLFALALLGLLAAPRRSQRLTAAIPARG